MKFNKKIVTFSISFVVIYTIFVMYNFYVHGIEPSVLTPYVYSFFGGELLILGGIKAAETMKGGNGND